MKPITVVPPLNDHLMAGQTVYGRLIAARWEIAEARNSKERKAAQKALVATEIAWEIYNRDPNVLTWAELQSIGNGLDAALRKMRGETVGKPGVMPPCVTGKESWCREPQKRSMQ